MANQKFIQAQYYDVSVTEPFLLEVQAYGMTFKPSWVKHGTKFTCPEPAIDNVKIFRVEDYPKEVATTTTTRKRRTKKVEDADITE